MSFYPGSVGSDLPGERKIAAYGEEEITLTTHRIIHKNRGTRRRRQWSIDLMQVTAVGLDHKRIPRPLLFVVPVAVVLFFFAIAVGAEHPFPFFFGLAIAFTLLPLPWIGLRNGIQIATPGFLLTVPVPRRRRSEAESFLHMVERQIFERRSSTTERTEEELPTTVPYQG